MQLIPLFPETGVKPTDEVNLFEEFLRTKSGVKLTEVLKFCVIIVTCVLSKMVCLVFSKVFSNIVVIQNDYLL